MRSCGVSYSEIAHIWLTWEDPSPRVMNTYDYDVEWSTRSDSQTYMDVLKRAEHACEYTGPSSLLPNKIRQRSL